MSGIEPREPEYWAEVEAAWEGRSERPAPRHLGRMRGGVLAAMMLILTTFIAQFPDSDDAKPVTIATR